MKRNPTLLVFSNILCSFTVLAAQKFVSTTGNNAQPGTNTAPWQTIQFGIDHIQAGDTLVVSAGVYNEKISFSQGGNSGAYLTVLAENPGVILDGTGLSADAMIAINGYSYIRIEGFEIRNNIQNDAQGIVVRGGCDHIELISNKIHDIHFSANPNDIADQNHNAQGIIVLGDNAAVPVTNLLIAQNELYNCRLGYSEGIAVNGNVDGFVIEQNTVHDLTNIGIVAIGHEQTSADPGTDQARNGAITRNLCYNCNSPYAYCGGIYIDGARSVVITRNFCHSNDYGIEVGCEHPGKTASEITTRNNIMANNKSSGFAFGGYDYPANSGSVINSTFQSNTLVENDVNSEGSGELTLNYTENCVIGNNIFYASGQGIGVSFAVTSVNPLFDYNLYYTTAGDLSALITTPAGDYTLQQFQATGQEPEGLFGNPVLGSTLTDAGSYVADQASAGRNNGDPNYAVLASETDYFGNPRQILQIDRGAAEYTGDLGLPEQGIAEIFLYPNPAENVVILNAENEPFCIFTVDGKSVKRGISSSGKIDVADLPAGSYIVIISKGSAKFTKR